MDNEAQISIQKLDRDNLPKFIELIKLFEDVFDMKDFSIPDSQHLQDVLKRDDFAVFVATSEGKVVGGLTTYTLHQYYSKKPLAYIFDLAVDSNLQRKGIGKRLITATKQYYKDKGFQEVFVQADQVDDHAVEFYRATHPTEEEQVLHFYYTLHK